MSNDERVGRLVQAIENLAETSGQKEATKVIPNCRVVDADPADIPGYIIVENELGYYVPAIKSPDITYQDDDLVNLLIIKGTEPIAFQHGTGSGTGGYPGALPLTTKGDIVTRDSSDNIRLGVEENDKVLTAVSSEASGLDWVYPSKLIAPDGSPNPAWEVDNTGNLEGATGLDVYPDGDIFGLWSRLINYGFTPDEHWPQNTDELAWTGWAAYTGFVTPDSLAISNSIYQIAHGAGAAKAFRYRAAATGGQIFLRGRVSITQICSAGLMIDDGVDDGDSEGATNFVRVYLQQATAGGNAINAVEQHRTGGGAVTTNTSTFTLPPGVFTGLSLNSFGTLWTSWLAQAAVFGESGARVIFLNTANMSWTPARVGLYWVGTAANATRIGLFDWYDEATS